MIHLRGSSSVEPPSPSFSALSKGGKLSEIRGGIHSFVSFHRLPLAAVAQEPPYSATKGPPPSERCHLNQLRREGKFETHCVSRPPSGTTVFLFRVRRHFFHSIERSLQRRRDEVDSNCLSSTSCVKERAAAGAGPRDSQIVCVCYLLRAARYRQRVNERQLVSSVRSFQPSILTIINTTKLGHIDN